MFPIEASAISMPFLSHTLPLHPVTHALVNIWKLTETAFYCYAHSALFNFYSYKIHHVPRKACFWCCHLDKGQSVQGLLPVSTLQVRFLHILSNR